MVFIVIVVHLSILLFVLKGGPDTKKSTGGSTQRVTMDARQGKKQSPNTPSSHKPIQGQTNQQSMDTIVFFDTETTSVNPGNICQLAYVIYDGKCYQGKNYYFAVNHVDPGAQRVHGLSLEKLNRLSGNRRFSHWAHEIHQDFSRADVLVAHNIEFDLKF